MGKKDSAQRTKGNTKPSSSARSAELLGSSGGGFIGFGQVPLKDPSPLTLPSSAQADGGAIPTTTTLLSGVDLEGASIPPEAKVALKRMSKRDVTTKIKGLQEFNKLILNFSEPEVRELLPFWTRTYSKVSTEHDRRIREAAQIAHRAVASKAGRNLAPHLKSLMPTWFLCQMDPHAPVATQAQIAFHEAFPVSKRKSVLIFCQKEILALIEDNLLHQTPQTLSDPKISSKEEMDSKYERTLSMSLLAFANFLSIFQPAEEELDEVKNEPNPNEKSDHDKEMVQFYITLLESGKFWKFANHKSSSIRSSWFRVLSCLCPNLERVSTRSSSSPAAAAASETPPKALPSQEEREQKTKDHDQGTKIRKFLSKLVQTAFTQLDEPDVLVSSAIWDGVLTFASTCQDWHTHLSFEKCVIPKLRRVLAEGCCGNGTLIYPKILPLLNQFPNELFNQGPMSQIFFEALFSDFKDGILKKVPPQISEESPSLALEDNLPRQASSDPAPPTTKRQGVLNLGVQFKHGVAAYFECMRYVLAKTGERDRNLAQNLTTQISIWIEEILASQKDLPKNAEIVFGELGQLLSFLAKKPECSNAFDALWMNLSDITLKLSSSSSSDCGQGNDSLKDCEDPSHLLGCLGLLMAKINPSEIFSIIPAKSSARISSPKRAKGPRGIKFQFQDNDDEEDNDHLQGKNGANEKKKKKKDRIEPEITDRGRVDITTTRQVPERLLAFQEKWLSLTTQLAVQAFITYEEDPEKHRSQLYFFNQLLQKCGQKSGFYQNLASNLPQKELLKTEQTSGTDQEVQAASAIMDEIVFRRLASMSKSSQSKMEISKLALSIYQQRLVASRPLSQRFFHQVLSLDSHEWKNAFLIQLGPLKLTDDNVRQWLASPQYGAMIQNEAQRLFQTSKVQQTEGHEALWNLLKTLLRHGDFISEAQLTSILQSFSEGVRKLTKECHLQSDGKEQALHLVCDLLDLLQSSNRLCWHVNESRNVLLAMIAIDCDNIQALPEASVQLRGKVRQVWTHGSRVILRQLAPNLEKGTSDSNLEESSRGIFQFCSAVAQVMRTHLSSMVQGEKWPIVATGIVSVASEFLRLLREQPKPVEQDDDDGDQYAEDEDEEAKATFNRKLQQKTLSQMLPDTSEWMAMWKSSETLAFSHFILAFSPGRDLVALNRRGSHDLTIDDERKTNCDDLLRSMVTRAMFFDLIVPEILGQPNRGNITDKEAKQAQDSRTRTDLGQMDDLVEPFCQHLHSVSFIGHILLREGHLDLICPKNTPERKHVQKMCSQDRIQVFVRSLAPECVQTVISRLLDKSLDYGHGWALTFKDFASHLLCGGSNNDQWDLNLTKMMARASLGTDPRRTAEPRVQTIQVLLALTKLQNDKSALKETDQTGHVAINTFQNELGHLMSMEAGTDDDPLSLSQCEKTLSSEMHASLALLSTAIHTLARESSSHLEPKQRQTSKTNATTRRTTTMTTSSMKKSQSSQGFKADEQSLVTSFLDWMERLKQGREEKFLFARAVNSKEDWDSVLLVRLLCNALSGVILLARNRFDSTQVEAAMMSPDSDAVVGPLELKESHWDMILCSLSSWIQSIDESRKQANYANNMLLTGFASDVVDLVTIVAEIFANPDQSGLIVPVHSKEEWSNFFCEGIYSVVFAMFMQLAGDLPGKNRSQQLISRLSEALLRMPDEQLFGHQLEPLFLVDDVDSEGVFPDHLVFLLNHLSPLITSDIRPLQVTSFHLLGRTIDKLIVEEEKIEEKCQSSATESDGCREFPRRFTELLARTQPVVVSLFQEFDFGDPIILPEDTTAHTYTLAYILTWRLILRLTSQASVELRPKYSETMRREEHMDILIPTLFHLMQIPNLDLKEDGKCFRGEVSLPPQIEPALGRYCQPDSRLLCSKSKPPPLQQQYDEGDELQSLACKTYRDLLRQLPALIRNWWINTEKKNADLVEKLTVRHVTPIIWEEQVHIINESKTKFDNMTIKVRPSVREVVAVYTVDDGSIELVVILPTNFPLGPVKVESGKWVGVGSSQWRTWMLQLTNFLQNQDGSILDSLNVWKKNVDKRFEGVEECYICFYVLHGTNHKLPKLACRACKKKFHSACLYKWFSTSNNSTCPLCRSLF